MIIITNKPGQLGNRLIVFAHCIAFSKENNVKIIDPAFDEYASHFISTQNNLLCSYPPKYNFISNTIIRHINYIFFYYFTRVLIRLRIKNKFVSAYHIDWNENINMNSDWFVSLCQKTKFLFLQGWNIRDKENIVKHQDLIRNFFKPLPKYIDNVDHLISSARNNCQILIGIHIRHIGYKQFEEGKYFYDIEIYIKQIKHLLTLFKNEKIGFLICSDVKLNKGLFKDLNCFWGTGHFMEDIYSFAKCDFILGPPSTYTIWASFYGSIPLYLIHSKNDYPKHTEDFKLFSA